jgi:hypothetical protein
LAEPGEKEEKLGEIEEKMRENPTFSTPILLNSPQDSGTSSDSAAPL